MIPRPTVLLLLACLLVAPVAVVCAVGVWRAARPRPEVLTMPAPRRTLAALAALILILGICSPAVSADGNIAYFNSDDLPLSVTYEHKSAVIYTKTLNGDNFANVGSTSTGSLGIVLKSVENYRDLNYVYIEHRHATGEYRDSIKCYKDIPTGEFTGTYIRPSDNSIQPIVVYVDRYYNILGSETGIRILAFPQNWAIGTKTGLYYSPITFNGTTYSFEKTRPHYNYVHGAKPSLDTPISGGIFFKTGPGAEISYCIGFTGTAKVGVVGSNHIKNVINIVDKKIGMMEVSALRQFDGNNYASEIGVYDKNNALITYDNDIFDVVLGRFDSDTFGKVTIKVPSLPEFNHTLIYDSTVTTPTPTNASVTVYVRNSQTGALLADAHLSILAATGGTETEIINATLPDGTGTYSLEKADYLKYLATATAPGYTLLSPIIFGVPEGGTIIILWMAPDAPPDVPTEPEKSMLYGYVQTQGSQQPIAGATVSLAGSGSTTTSSTGFYLFNNVTPGAYTISASAPLHDALSEPVTVETVATPYNLALKGHFLLTVTAKDDTSLANLHNATISLSDGQESTQNPATFNVDYGPYTITAAAGGYYPQTQSAYLDKPGTTTTTVLMTAKPEPIPPPEMPNYPPHNVKFSVMTLLGTPIPGVTVTAQGIQQTPSTNILERLLGLNTTSTPITTELMSGTTDSNGEINFMMIEAVKYRISLYKPDVVNQTFEIYPKEDTYPIRISTLGGPLLPDAGDALRDIRINVTTSTEGDTGHIHIDYNDTTLKTTGLTIQVTQQNTTNTSAPEEVIASYTVANDANVTHTFDLLDYKGQSFFVRLEAEHPDFGTINRDYAVAFKGVRVPLGPLPDGLYIYVAGFGLTLLGGIFGATSATRGVVVIAFAGWLFYAFGWLDDLGLIAPVSLGLVSTIAVMGVIVTRYKEEGYQ